MSSKQYLPIVLGLVFLFLGIALTWISLLYESVILTFIGLATLFWGSLLLFIRPNRSVTSIIFDATTSSSLEALNQLITSMDYNGEPIYIPKQLSNNQKTERVFISKASNKPILSEPLTNSQDTSIDPKGLYIIPPGLELSNLFEKKLGKKFTKVSLDYLAQYVPKLFIQDLELAKNCEFSITNNLVTVNITGLINSYQRLSEQSIVSNKMGNPFVSAIACVLVRSTGKPVLIQETTFNKKKNRVQVTYAVLGD